MTHYRFLATTFAFVYAAFLASNACLAQPDDEQDIRQFHVLRDVLVMGRGELSNGVMENVAELLVQRYATENAPEGAVHIIGVNLNADDGSRVSDDAAIYSLQVWLQTAADAPSEKQRRELWEKTRMELERSLRQVQHAARDRQRAEFEARLDQLESQRKGAEVDLEDAIRQLEAIGADSSGSQEQLRQQLAASLSMSRELQLERVSLDALRPALEERIDQLRTAAENEGADDPMIGELLKIRNLREKQLEAARKLYDSGQIKSTELVQIESDLANARIDLLKAQRAAAEHAGGALLRELNDELSKLFVKSAELDAKSKAVAEIVAELRHQTSVRVRIEAETIEFRIRSLRERLRQMEEALANARQERDASPKNEITIRPLVDLLTPEDSSP